MTEKTDMEICEAATPGPWYVGDEDTVPNAIIVKMDDPAWPGGPDCANLLSTREMDDGDYPVVLEHEDAEHIARFNPAKTKEMLEENARLRRERDDARRAACWDFARLLQCEPGTELYDITAKKTAVRRGWDCYQTDEEQ